MWRFQYPEAFWLFIFILIILGFLLDYFFYRKKRLLRFANAQNLKNIMNIPNKAHSVLSPIFIVFASVLMVVALANLQKGEYGQQSALSKGSNVIIALDVSKSMMAKDIQPNRLDFAKLTIKKLIDKSKGDKFGLLIFAGNAFNLMPLTSDYTAILSQLGNINTSMVPIQGTALEEALSKSALMLEQEKMNHNVIVLITDGEDHEEGALSEAARLKNDGIKVITVGVGSKEGANIFEENSNKPKKDLEGNVIVSKLNEEILKSIANKDGGAYVYANSVQQTSNDILSNIEGMGQNIFQESNFQIQKSYFYIFILWAFLFLILEWLLSFNFKNLKLKKSTLPMVALILFSFCSFSQNKNSNETTLSKADLQKFNKYVFKANNMVLSNQLDSARSLYGKALEINPNDPIVNFNFGNMCYMKNDFENAIKYFETAASNDSLKANKALDYHNLGTTYIKQKNWDGAIEALKNSLRNNPNSENTRYNLIYAQKMKKNDKGGGKDNKQNQDKQNQDKQNQDNQNQDNQNQDKQNQDKQNQDKQNQDKQKQNQDKQNQDKQNHGQRPSKLSKEQAEQLLNALRQQEKKLHDGKEIKGDPTDLKEKDW